MIRCGKNVSIWENAGFFSSSFPIVGYFGNVMPHYVSIPGGLKPYVLKHFCMQTPNFHIGLLQSHRSCGQGREGEERGEGGGDEDITLQVT